MSNWKEGQFSPEHLKNLREGITLFNRKDFWMCHEVLEDPWMESLGDPARDVYWAIIQVAVSLYHFENKNQAGANGMLEKAKKKFLKCEKSKVESEFLNESLNWVKLKNLVYAIPSGSDLSQFEKLYLFRFKDPTIWEKKWNL